MRDVLLHGEVYESFDRSVAFARRLAESYGATLHVLYTLEDPLSAGWTAEMSADRMPDVHQAMEAEARERLAAFIPVEEQEALGVIIALETGDAATALVRYTQENPIDLVVLKSDTPATELAHTVLDQSTCTVIVLR